MIERVALLFVYGTLRPGYYNYECWRLSEKSTHRGRAEVHGAQLFGLGSYPCMVMTSDPGDRVTGELLEIHDESTLEDITGMEEEAGYEAKIVETDAGRALAFIFETPPEGAGLIVSGDWSKIHQGA